MNALIVYVDDIVVTENDKAEMRQLKKRMAKESLLTTVGKHDSISKPFNHRS